MGMSDYDTLDIKDWQQEGNELRQAIYDAVRKTQVPIMLPLPNRLVMTKAQFDMLKTDADMSTAHGSTEQLYRTDMNIMQVIVVD